MLDEDLMLAVIFGGVQTIQNVRVPEIWILQIVQNAEAIWCQERPREAKTQETTFMDVKIGQQQVVKESLTCSF